MRFHGFGGEIARIIFLARLGPRLNDARTSMCGATGDISVALALCMRRGESINRQDDALIIYMQSWLRVS